MTVSQLIRDLNDYPPLSRIHLEGSNLIIGNKWMIRLDTEDQRKLSEIYEDNMGVKRDK